MREYQFEKKAGFDVIPQFDQPRPDLFREISRGDSSLYDPYQLRPYNPAELWQKKGNYDLYDEMREDDQISALLTLKKFFILNGEFSIETEDPKIKQFLELNFKFFYNGFFEKSLFNILSALDYGFSLTEKIFKYQDIPGFGKKIVLHKLKTRPPHSFEFDQDDSGNIIRIRQDHMMGADIELDTTKMMHYTYQSEFDNPYGSSELNLGVYRAWWSKNAIIKFWNIFLERFGMPTAVGKYPKGMIQHLADLKKTLKNIQAKTSIVIPEDVEIQLLQAGKEGGGYEKAIDKYNTMIARKMLIPDLMGLSGSETGGGSFALGKSQFDMFYNNIQHERENLQRIINKDIIFPLVAWNFGTSSFAEIRFKQPDRERKDKDLAVWLDSVKSGKIPVTDTHINWFLQQVNAPEIDQSELDKIKEEKEAFKQGLQNGQGNKETGKEVAKDDEGGDEKKGKDDSKNEKEDNNKNEKQFAKFNRELTKAEKRVNFAQIERETKGLEEEYTRQLGEAYRLVINALLNDIKTRKIVEKKRLDLINKLQLKHQNKTLKIWESMFKDGFKLGNETMEKVENFQIDITVGLEGEEINKYLLEFAQFLNKEEATNILDNVKGVLLEAIKSGMGIKETMKNLEVTLEDYNDILSQNDQKTRRLERIARTSINDAFNQARKENFNKAINQIQAFQFSAILDDRTSPICKKMDKTIFRKTDLDFYNPPLHPNCRSVLVAILIDDNLEDFTKDGTGAFTPENTPPAVEPEKFGFLKLKKEKK